jgi:hypothetical protein
MCYRVGSRCAWQKGSGVNRLPNAVVQFVFADKMRRYLTFRWMTIFVVVLLLWNVVFGVLFRKYAGPLPMRHRLEYDLLSSHLFLVIFNAALAVGFWLIYASRHRKEFYQVRVVTYAMLLGSVAGELLRFCFT